MLGQTILHYRIIEQIGQGGMGVVYKAEDTKLKREVAIKFLPNYIASNEEAKKRFEIEAQAAASLNHPNVTTIYAIEESDENVFIVMEYIEGFELKDKINSTPLPYDETINIALQIIEGLDAAHKKGIVHRDIKASNIMITKDGKVKVMDFGLAKIRGGSDLTRLGTTIGTVAYMSPEQTTNQEIDGRSDIWSFGVLLFEMLTGMQPFKGGYDQAIIYSILNDEPDYSNLYEGVSAVLQKALSKEMSGRYNNSSEVLEDLRILKNESLSKTFSKKTYYQKFEKKSNKKSVISSAAVLFVIIIIASFLLFINKGGDSGIAAPSKSMIVVLPFENLGSLSDKYFADGVTEEITSKLTSMGNIGVIATSSAEKIAKANKTTTEIGSELGVNYILSGTIRWAKNGKDESRVRITPQLIKVADNTIIWSESYDKVLNDIFAVQNEIAQKVADQFGESLSGSLVSNEIKLTDNLQAYDFYLQGISYFKRGQDSQPNIQNSIELFKKAIALDPNFASAYARLSRSLSAMYWFYYDRSKKNMEDALSYAQKAYELNPDLADVYIANGFYYYWYKLNYKKAIEEYSNALRLQPNNSEALMATGYVYRRMGNLELAKEFMIKGLSLNPIDPEFGFNTAQTMSLLRNYDGANKYFKQTIDLNPDYIGARVGLAANYVNWTGDLKSAERIMNGAKDNDRINANLNLGVLIDVLKRDYNQAINELASTKIEFQRDQFRYIPNELVLGLIYRYKNDDNSSKIYLETAKNKISGFIRNNPDDERLHSTLGVIYAGVGENQKAVDEGKRGIELLPLEKEAFRGYYRQWDMAIIYTLIGDNNNALKQIDFILSIPGTFSVNQLKLDPVYDSLRNLPGYKAIIDKYSKN